MQNNATKFKPEPLLTVKEFADMSRISLPGVYLMIHSGAIRAIRIGKLFRITESEARRLLTLASAE